jgi:hypothetical protein
VGGVLHVLPWISVFYNASRSINVPPEFRVLTQDPASGEHSSLAPLRDGQTRDYGLKFDLFGHRLFATATRFETEAHNDAYFSGFTSVTGGINNIWDAIRNSGGATSDEVAIANSARAASVSAFLLDSRTEGYEVEVVGEPVRGWSVSVNYSWSDSTRENMATEVRNYIDHFRPLWLKYADLAITQSATLPGAERNTPNDFNSPQQIAALGDFTANTDTIAERLVDLEDAFFDGYHVYNGTRYVGHNKHNLNLRTRYVFREGLLKGFTAGAGTRLRFGRVAGSLVDYEFTQGSSYTDAYNGRVAKNVRLVEAVDQAIFDLQLTYRRPWRSFFGRQVDWSVQLNINNVTDEDDYIVNQTHPTTGTPLTYRYQNPRVFILTNTFSF